MEMRTDAEGGRVIFLQELFRSSGKQSSAPSITETLTLHASLFYILSASTYPARFLETESLPLDMLPWTVLLLTLDGHHRMSS